MKISVNRPTTSLKHFGKICFFAVLIAFFSCMQSQTALAQDKESSKESGKESTKDSTKEPRRKDARLNFKTLSYTMSQEKKKTKVTQKSGTTTSTEVSSDQTQKEDNWNFYSSLPVIGGTFYANGIVVNTSIWGLLGFIGGSTSVGREISPVMHVGVYTDVNYRVSKNSTSSDGRSTGSHDSSRSLGIGPYVHLTSTVEKASLESQFILAYLHEGDTSTSSGYDTKEKTGFGLDASFDYVKPLSKTLSYTGGFGLSYRTFNKGEEIDESNNSTRTTKINSDATTTISLSILGIRLSI